MSGIMDDRTPILRVRPADVAGEALVCGDAERAQQIIEGMEHARLIGVGCENCFYGRSVGNFRMETSPPAS